MTQKVVAKMMLSHMLSELNMREDYANQINHELSDRLFDGEYVIAINLASRNTHGKLTYTRFVATSFGAVWYHGGHSWINWIPPQHEISVYAWQAYDVRWVFFGTPPSDCGDLTEDVIKDRVCDVISDLNKSDTISLIDETYSWCATTRIG